MPRYLKNKDGTFAGSIGTGKSAAPQAAPQYAPATPDTSTSQELTGDIAALYARFGNTAPQVTGDSQSPDNSTNPATPIVYDQVLYEPATALHGIYTEYLANVDQLVYEDLDDMTGPYKWAQLEDDIADNGIKEPIEIGVHEDGEKYIINGCHRAVIAYRRKLASVPVIYRRD